MGKVDEDELDPEELVIGDCEKKTSMRITSYAETVRRGISYQKEFY